MKVLIIYDSAFGNTAIIAHAVKAAVKMPHTSMIKLVIDTQTSDLKDADLVIVGSPTQGGFPTQDIKQFLDSLPEDILQGKYVATFDTRFSSDQHGVGLKLLMKVLGFAAPHMADILCAKGGTLAAEPIGFIVEDKKGPLEEGEQQRAVKWAEELLQKTNDVPERNVEYSAH